MAYEPSLLRRALAEFNASKTRRETERSERRSSIYAEIPRLEEIDRSLRLTMAQLMQAAFQKGEDPGAAIEKIKRNNLGLQSERERLLLEHGIEESELDEGPACAECGDTGYRGEVMCSCLKDIYAREQQKKLSGLLKLGEENFDTFSLEYYSDVYQSEYGVSPRENMELVYEICLDYARKFRQGSGNLFFNGGTGLGKTFLAACIARDVSEAGFSVVYDTAISIFSNFEAAKFGNSALPLDAAAIDGYLGCDLLIFDDLGTEMMTQFISSALYNLINTRLMKNLSTIITTNLSMDEMRRRYPPPIISRIEGEYIHIPFFGKDIRVVKRDEAYK